MENFIVKAVNNIYKIETIKIVIRIKILIKMFIKICKVINIKIMFIINSNKKKNKTQLQNFPMAKSYKKRNQFNINKIFIINKTILKLLVIK